MKKLFSIFAFLMLISFSSLASASINSIDGKVGTAYGTDAEKFGLQFGFSYLTELDKYFAIGIEPTFSWTSWDVTLGSETTGGVSGITVDKKADTDAYMLPIMAVAQVRMANLQESIGVAPYLSVGFGYSLMAFHYSNPRYDDGMGGSVEADSDTDFYHGFTWQLVGGVSFKPGDDAKVDFILEAGYRSAKLDRDDVEIDMSGFMANIGFRYPLQ